MPETPPNYQKAVARFDRVCRLCSAYQGGLCRRYEVPVEHDFTCGAWSMDWKEEVTA